MLRIKLKRSCSGVTQHFEFWPLFLYQFSNIFLHRTPCFFSKLSHNPFTLFYSLYFPIFWFWSESARELSTRLKITVQGFPSTFSSFYSGIKFISNAPFRLSKRCQKKTKTTSIGQYTSIFSNTSMLIWPWNNLFYGHPSSRKLVSSIKIVKVMHWVSLKLHIKGF